MLDHHLLVFLNPGFEHSFNAKWGFSVDPFQDADYCPAFTGFSPTPLLLLLLPEAVSLDPPSILMFLRCTLGMFPLVSIFHFKLETEKNYLSLQGRTKVSKSLSYHFFFMGRNWEDLELFFCRSGISVPFPRFLVEVGTASQALTVVRPWPSLLFQQGTVQVLMLYSTIRTLWTFFFCADSDLPVWLHIYLFAEMLSSSKWTQWWVNSGILSLQIEDSSVFLCCLLIQLLL